MWELILLAVVMLYVFYVLGKAEKLTNANTIATFTAQGTILGSAENDFLVLDLPILPISMQDLQIYNIYLMSGNLIKTASKPIEYYFSKQMSASKWSFPNTFENSLWKHILFDEEPTFNFDYFQLGNFVFPLYLCRKSKHEKIQRLLSRLRGSLFTYRIDSPIDMYAVQELQLQLPVRPLTLNTFKFISDEQYKDYTKSKLTRNLEWYDLIYYKNIRVRKALAAPSHFIPVDISEAKKTRYMYCNVGIFDSFVGTLKDEKILIGDHWNATPEQDGLKVEFDNHYWLVFNTNQASTSGLILMNQRFEIKVRDIIINKSYLCVLTPLDDDYTYTVDNIGIFTVRLKKFVLSYLGEVKN